MKRWIALLSAAALVFTLCACGNKTETETDPETTEYMTEAPWEGRIDEKDSFFVYIPEDWCKMEYAGDGQKIRLFNTPSAPDIKDDTEEIMIEMAQEKSESTEEALDGYMAHATSKALKDTKIGGYDFKGVVFTNPEEGRQNTVFVGLVGGHLTTVTLKGIPHTDQTAQKVLNSISFK